MKKAALAGMGLLLLASGCSSAPGQISTWTRLVAAVRARMSSGDAEVRRAFEEKAKAKSWRMRTEMRLHPGDPLVTLSEVSCPDHQRLTGALGERPLYESVRVGDRMYFRDQDKKEDWYQRSIQADDYPCGNNAGVPAPWAIMNEGRDMSTALALLLKQAKATVNVSTLEVVDGATCQNWVIQFGHPGKGVVKGGNTMNYSVCIDTATHLPHRISMGTGGVTVKYYDWNKPIEIAAPENAAPAPSEPTKAASGRLASSH